MAGLPRANGASAAIRRTSASISKLNLTLTVSPRLIAFFRRSFFGGPLDIRVIRVIITHMSTKATQQARCHVLFTPSEFARWQKLREKTGLSPRVFATRILELAEQNIEFLVRVRESSVRAVG